MEHESECWWQKCKTKSFSNEGHFSENWKTKLFFCGMQRGKDTMHVFLTSRTQLLFFEECPLLASCFQENVGQANNEHHKMRDTIKADCNSSPHLQYLIDSNETGYLCLVPITYSFS